MTTATRWLKSLSEATTVGKSSDEKPPQDTDASVLGKYRKFKDAPAPIP